MSQAAAVRRRVARLIRPSLDLTVAEAAARALRTSRGPWDPARTPMLIMPMNRLASRDFIMVVLVGPAQSGKTETMTLGWLAYIMLCSPGDVLLVEKSFVDARDFSRRRLDRMFRHSPELKSLLGERNVDDNTFDKCMLDGSIIKLGWPSIKQLSGRPIQYGMATDYDRMPEDVDFEGTVADHLRRRGLTYLSSAMTLIESSPGREILDPTWRQKTPHEGPPATGIMALYNRGDRSRWYWRCRACRGEFMPTIDRLVYDGNGTPSSRAASVIMACPHCGSTITHAEKMWHNQQENGARWLAEWEVMGTEPDQSRIASHWFEGPAAVDQTWEGIVLDSILAELEYQRTGDETALKTTVSQTQGRPYMPKRLRIQRPAHSLEARAEDYPPRVIPSGAQLLLAAVDIQSNRFVVQVVAFGPGRECWLIDRYDLALSARVINGEPQIVDPASHDDDWDLLTEKVARASYPLADESGRAMRVRLTACDSAGQPGVTDCAYRYWRRLRQRGQGKSIMLIKGRDSARNAPRVQLSYPDTSGRKDRAAGSRGDVPVLRINSNALKDALHADLAIEQPGPGYIHLPTWVDSGFWDELNAEVNTPKGWTKVGARNEAWDLFCYARALLIYLGGESWGDCWEGAPPWAGSWTMNPMIITPDAQPSPPSPPTISQAPARNWIQLENRNWLKR